MNHASFGALFLVIFGCANMASADCSDITSDFVSTETENNNMVAVHYRTQPTDLPVGAFFTMDIQVCKDSKPWIGELTIEATMPAHGHGMNYRPQVKQVESGAFHAEGFLFQMPGQWRFDFSLPSDQGGTHAYSFVDVGG